MDLFEILRNLYCNNRSDWINGLDNNEIQPFLINKWLMMNDELIKYCDYLNNYSFILEPKHWLYLAWLIVPKRSKTPFVKYIKKSEVLSDYEELKQKIYDFMEIKGSDISYYDRRLKNLFNENLVGLMKFFGMPKKVWKKYGLDFKEMYVEDTKRNVKKGLDLWI